MNLANRLGSESDLAILTSQTVQNGQIQPSKLARFNKYSQYLHFPSPNWPDSPQLMHIFLASLFWPYGQLLFAIKYCKMDFELGLSYVKKFHYTCILAKFRYM